MPKPPLTASGSNDRGLSSSIQEWKAVGDKISNRVDGPAFVGIHGPLNFTFMDWILAGSHLRSVTRGREGQPIMH